jgi:membrane protease YdiL (CAAX protease family)
MTFDPPGKATAIGAALTASPRLLGFTTLAAVLVIGADVALVVLGVSLGLDATARLTLALLALLACALLGAAHPAGSVLLGFRGRPRQGWWFWVRGAVLLGVALSVILLGTRWVVFVCWRFPLPEPRFQSRSEIGSLGLWMCVTAPLAEEVVYRLVFCPPFAALLGDRLCILLNGSLFAGLHVLYGHPSPENLLGGFILCWAYLKSETLLVPLSLHAGGNACAFLANVAYFYWWHGSAL